MARVAHVERYRRVAGQRDERKAPVQHHEQREGAHRLDERLHRVGEAVVERLRDGIDVVGEVAHDVTIAHAVEERQRQALYVGEKVTPDVVDDPLRRTDHGLGVAPGSQGTQRVDGRREDDQADESLVVTCAHRVDDGLYHVGPQKCRKPARRDEHRHGQELHARVAHVGQKRPQRVAQVPRTRGHPSPSSHPRPPPRGCPILSETHRAPDRWDRLQAVRHACPRRGRARRPGSRSGRSP